MVKRIRGKGQEGKDQVEGSLVVRGGGEARSAGVGKK